MPLAAPLLVALLHAAAPGEPAAPPAFGFDRVDLLSEDPGTWLHHDVPLLPGYPVIPLVRFVEQVKPVFHLPVRGLYAGVSIGSQSLVYEHPLWEEKGLFWSAGLQTRLLYPSGALLGVAWRFSRFRVGLSLSCFTDSGWGRPVPGAVSFLPTLGFGIGRDRSSPPDAGAPR